VDGLDVGKIVEMSNCSWVFASKNHEAIKQANKSVQKEMQKAKSHPTLNNGNIPFISFHLPVNLSPSPSPYHDIAIPSGSP
jgi:hypothetical protein